MAGLFFYSWFSYHLPPYQFKLHSTRVCHRSLLVPEALFGGGVWSFFFGALTTDTGYCRRFVCSKATILFCNAAPAASFTIFTKLA